MNENQTKSKYQAVEISGFISFTILLMVAFLLKHWNYPIETIISISLGIAGSINPIIFYILSEINIIKYMNKPIKIKYPFFITVILLITILFIYDYYRLSGAEEGKINCIFPDGQRRDIPLGEIHNEELISVFPQLEDIPFATIQTYATNGAATSKFYEDKLRSNYYEINFTNFEATLDCNTGWMIGPLMGFDAKKYSCLSFEVKGTKGGENFGIKLKDENGRESKINLTELEFEVTTNWQVFNIDLQKFDHFTLPDRSDLNVITIFSDGSMYSEKGIPETIHVRGFKFE